MTRSQLTVHVQVICTCNDVQIICVLTQCMHAKLSHESLCLSKYMYTCVWMSGTVGLMVQKARGKRYSTATVGN